jgi:hypothetical protein
MGSGFRKVFSAQGGEPPTSINGPGGPQLHVTGVNGLVGTMIIAVVARKIADIFR